jgi:cysteine-rich repeat protein
MRLTRRERNMKVKTIVAIAAVTVGTLALTTPVSAGGTPAQKCASSKQKASGKKAAGKFGCYSKGAGKSIDADPACLQKADSGFMAAFAKADPNDGADPGGVCEGIESDVEFSIDHCIDVINLVLIPGKCSTTMTTECTQTSQCPTGETCVQTLGKCPGAKLKATGKNLGAKAGCFAKATSKGLPTGGSNPDPTFTACIAKADTSLTSAFTKADGTTPCDGQASNVANVLALSCVQPVMGRLPPVAPGCGNGFQDPGESCDDGNNVDGDSCPANCIILPCTVDTTTHQSISVDLTTPPGVTVGALTLYLDYPEGKVRVPVTTPGSGVSDGPLNDLTYAFKDPVLDATFTDGIPANGTGAMIHVTFDRCQSQPLPVVADYSCKILDASDELGTSIDPATLGCQITIP